MPAGGHIRLHLRQVGGAVHAQQFGVCGGSRGNQPAAGQQAGQVQALQHGIHPGRLLGVEVAGAVQAVGGVADEAGGEGGGDGETLVHDWQRLLETA